ncbi:MAG TPA: FtsK/SpoIIIE domain-containing protein [Verrucomicrobiae bacterium]|nr:FtsK/SpoIIIE domain-containing protein [Verrucomicrobiae bacterium]
MSRNLAAGRALELLEQLRVFLEDFAARSAGLKTSFDAQLAGERRRADRALAEHEKQTDDSAIALDQSHQNARAAAQATFERRKAWLARAYQTSQALGIKRVDEKIGAEKYGLQRMMLQAERDRDAGLTATTARFEELRRDLAAEQERLAGLEHQARACFKGYPGFLRLFLNAYEKIEVSVPEDEQRALTELRERSGRAGTEIQRLQRYVPARLFKYWAVWLVLILCEVPLILQARGLNPRSYQWAGVAVGGSLVVVFLLRAYAKRRSRPLVASIAKGLAQARRFHDACFERSGIHYQQEMERLKNDYNTTTQDCDRQLKKAQGQAGDRRVACRMKTDERTVRANKRNEALYKARLERVEREFHDTQQTLLESAQVRRQALLQDSAATLKRLSAEHETTWRTLESEWRRKLDPFYAELQTLTASTEALFPPWDSDALKNWTPPSLFAQAARFGRLEVDLARFSPQLPADPRFALPGPARFPLPLCLAYPQQGSILFESGSFGHDLAISSLNNIILRLLAVAPPGRANFTILDPVGLGQNFAGVMHLADFEEQIIHNRIWTQATQIEQRLADLNEHMEKVIQMYLRNEYQTIAEYNEQAGVIAEKYHFLVVADFPANFTETATKRLLSIAASGARCGVYLLMHWDQRLPLPQEFIPDELRKAAVRVVARNDHFELAEVASPGARLMLDAPPPPEVATEFIQQVGRLSRDSSRVEVPFEQIAPPEAEIWSEETTDELRVPIGRTGATKLQYLAIGKGTRQHGLVAGKTGSGKSTLFHVLITNLALWCSPDQVEFYLVDFKKGVEFKCYAARRLPHARVVAIESDREFGLSVLQRVDDELKRRGDLFRQLGVQDLAGYKRAGGTEVLPRTLLLIDEFQEFFVEDDKIGQTASLLLDRIVRQGRAFGIHVLLGSQTLGGAYTVARTTLGQMVIRIALQCNEADAYLIMDDSNPAPRLLSRPGEGIYNDMAGALEGNSPFQVVWLPEAVRDSWLGRVRARADQNGKAYPGPIVFEGNAPADVRENSLLTDLLATKPAAPPAAGRIWLGAPNSIKGPTEATFHRQSGNNLLLVGQRDEAVLAIFSVGLLSLAAQFPPDAARIIFCDASPPGTAPRDYLESLFRALARPLTVAKPGEVTQVMQELDAAMKQRAEEPDPEAAPPVFLFIHGLQKFPRLRFEEDFGFGGEDAQAAANPAVVLNNLLCEGTRLGFHVIASCDTYNNVARFLSRKAVSEFEMRVLFQMSVNDSASLIDSPKAGLLGLHRALFFNAQEGYLETFRPYALPPREWLEQAAREVNGK